MKVLILAGGQGTRISEESHLRPKPMIEISGKPILWHIMKIYSHYGLNDFVILAGHKAHFIKDYFHNYYLYNSDITFDLHDNSMVVHNSSVDKWKVTVLNTGEDTMTGGRIKQAASYLSDDEDFCLTYGDGVGNIHIGDLIAFHQKHGKLATVTAVSPSGRFGRMEIHNQRVLEFTEKPENDLGKINGGFFVLSKKVLNYIGDNSCVWEKSPLERLASDKELMAFSHNGFWHPMDTLRDKRILEEIWDKGDAPWKCW